MTQKSYKMQPIRLSIKDVTKGIMARLMFGTLGLCGVLLATMITKIDWYWFLALNIPLLIAEGIATIKGKKEWKCIEPCVVIFMSMVVPSLILIELQLDMLDTRQVDMMMSNMSNMSMTEMNTMMNMPMEHQRGSSEVKSGEVNNMSSLENNTALQGLTENMASNMNISAQSLEMYLRMKVAWLCTEDSGCNWDYFVEIYKQVFIFVLIIGCWLDPNTILTKIEKAELLLMNFGVAFDVLEFLQMTNDVRKKFKTPLIGVPFLLPATLAVWTWSLLQFTLVFKAKYYQKTIDLCPNRSNTNSAFWEVFISLMLMEIPFLVFRLVMIFYFGCVNKSIIFFAAKNLLIILMQFYRLYAEQTEKQENNDAQQGSTEFQPINDA